MNSSAPAPDKRVELVVQNASNNRTKFAGVARGVEQ